MLNVHFIYILWYYCTICHLDDHEKIAYIKNWYGYFLNSTTNTTLLSYYFYSKHLFCTLYEIWYAYLLSSIKWHFVCNLTDNFIQLVLLIYTSHKKCIYGIVWKHYKCNDLIILMVGTASVCAFCNNSLPYISYSSILLFSTYFFCCYKAA